MATGFFAGLCNRGSASFAPLVRRLAWHGATSHHHSPIHVAALLPKVGTQLFDCSTSRRLLAAGAVRFSTMTDQELSPRAQAILNFWFGEGWETAAPDDKRAEKFKIWFQGGPAVDAEIVDKFMPDCEALLSGECDSWVALPQGALAGIVLGDQLFRNAFRGQAKMYAADGRVLGWAKALMASGADRQLLPIQRVFVYMPLMHSEELADQEECVARFEALAQECAEGGLPNMAEMAQGNVKYAKSHLDVVQRWGRFPHRNAILERPSTEEEAAGIAAGTIAKW